MIYEQDKSETMVLTGKEYQLYVTDDGDSEGSTVIVVNPVTDNLELLKTVGKPKFGDPTQISLIKFLTQKQLMIILPIIGIIIFKSIYNRQAILVLNLIFMGYRYKMPSCKLWD